MKKANEIDKKNTTSYVTLSLMEQFIDMNCQIPHTLNTLNIFLLEKQLERWNKSKCNVIYDTINKKFNIIERTVTESNKWSFLVKESTHRSKTISCLQSSEENINRCYNIAEKSNIILGKSYGNLQNNTIRIANFPSTTIEEITLLLQLLVV